MGWRTYSPLDRGICAKPKVRSQTTRVPHLFNKTDVLDRDDERNTAVALFQPPIHTAILAFVVEWLPNTSISLKVSRMKPFEVLRELTSSMERMQPCEADIFIRKSIGSIPSRNGICREGFEQRAGCLYDTGLADLCVQSPTALNGLDGFRGLDLITET